MEPFLGYPNVTNGRPLKSLRDFCENIANLWYVQGVPKKMSFLGKRAISIFKIILNAKVGGVLDNSGYLLPDGHRDFQN